MKKKKNLPGALPLHAQQRPEHLVEEEEERAGWDLLRHACVYPLEEGPQPLISVRFHRDVEEPVYFPGETIQRVLITSSGMVTIDATAPAAAPTAHIPPMLAAGALAAAAKECR
eukprot:CAMPEP_0180143854 /NCGR_PEP_ID=MMETSP0986-20121125/16529_1 /TAXON_ID=697907 /ORGANISM="non described non described, Strain CCMP2293" /LENGTH=113 /DNA_ID=CAMNT_0022087533 /DNA_START=131 /DNA_END=470 /DNA_ORIENTATION=-